MSQSSGKKRLSHHVMHNFDAGHGMEYAVYICLILIMLVSLYLDVVLN